MIYEPLFKLERTGVQIHYYTGKGKYNPVHWHSAIELIYVLNGNGSIMIDGKDYLVVAGDFVVLDSNQMHEVKAANASMMDNSFFKKQYEKLCFRYRKISFFLY